MSADSIHSHTAHTHRNSTKQLHDERQRERPMVEEGRRIRIQVQNLLFVTLIRIPAIETSKGGN